MRVKKRFTITIKKSLRKIDFFSKQRIGTYIAQAKEPHALCRDLADRPKDRRHKGQILAVWFQTDLQPLWQNLCLASDSKKVKTKSSLNSLGITDMVLDNQWASN